MVASTSPLDFTAQLTALCGGAWVSDTLKGYGEDGPELDRRNTDAVVPESLMRLYTSKLAGRRRYAQGNSREPRWRAPN